MDLAQGNPAAPQQNQTAEKQTPQKNKHGRKTNTAEKQTRQKNKQSVLDRELTAAVGTPAFATRS